MTSAEAVRLFFLHFYHHIAGKTIAHISSISDTYLNCFSSQSSSVRKYCRYIRIDTPHNVKKHR